MGRKYCAIFSKVLAENIYRFMLDLYLEFSEYFNFAFITRSFKWI
jgi:hypothetical protein